MESFRKRAPARSNRLFLLLFVSAVLSPALVAAQQEIPASDPLGSNYFNPKMAVVGNFVASGGTNGVEDRPSLSLEESELSLEATVDPYAKAAFFIGFGDGQAAVEEGYVAFTSLPAGFLLEAGRKRMPLGKVNALHAHALSTVDLPLPVENLLGTGRDGWSGDGITLSKLLPLPGEIFSELLVSATRPDAEGLFSSDRKRDLVWLARWRLFRDLGEDANIDLGLSGATGPNGLEEGSDTRLYAVDATWRWKPLAESNYRSFLIRGEAFRRETGTPEGKLRADGWYLSADWQLAPRWFAGARVESSDRANDPNLRDDGAALVLTFWPTEFQAIRGEVRRREYADARTATEAFVQLQFSIGAHGAHSF
jgi:hypothetical protein